MAGIFSVAVIGFVCVSFIGALDGKVPDVVLMAIIVITFVLTIFTACILFNLREERWPYQSIQELEDQGLVISQEFHARRALEVEEYEDEGLHYFLELNDGGVLFLSGQYLYDYLAIDDDPEFNQERRFPCTEFVVKRHRTQDYVLEIVTQGTPFEPEAIAPAFTGEDYNSLFMPEDGDIINDRSFETIKEERLRAIRR